MVAGIAILTTVLHEDNFVDLVLHVQVRQQAPTLSVSSVMVVVRASMLAKQRERRQQRKGAGQG